MNRKMIYLSCGKISIMAWPQGQFTKNKKYQNSIQGQLFWWRIECQTKRCCQAIHSIFLENHVCFSGKTDLSFDPKADVKLSVSESLLLSSQDHKKWRKIEDGEKEPDYKHHEVAVLIRQNLITFHFNIYISDLMMRVDNKIMIPTYI